jgi:hypothetical protein
VPAVWLKQVLSTDIVISIFLAGGPISFATNQRQDSSPSASRKTLVQPASSSSIRLRLKVAPQTGSNEIGPSDVPQKISRPRSARIEAVGEKRTSVQSDWEMIPPENKRVRRSTHAQSSAPGEMKGNAMGAAEQRSSNCERLIWTVLFPWTSATVQI